MIGRRLSSLLWLLACFSSITTKAIATPTLDELWTIVQAQQETIEQLTQALELTQSKLANTAVQLTQTEKRITATDAKAEATANVLESTAGAFSAGWADRTTIGGYGELHYNNLEDQAITADGGPDDLNRVDFHRFVLYFGHEFNPSLRFFSELEVEHALAGDGTPGEVELEQAWLEMDINPNHRVRAGVDILPLGIINPTHEPNTFYGVERNRVETEIIPATWWEAGVAVMGEIAPGWQYDFIVHSGLSVPISGGNAYRPRSGRLKVAKADDQDVALTGRIKYTAIPGLELSVAGQYQADITGTADAADIDAYLFEAHAQWQHRSGIALRALYAGWVLGSDTAAGFDPDLFGADNLAGFYIEPSYKFAMFGAMPGALGIFARYSEWDERNQLAAGGHRFERFVRADVGVNYWPTPNAVFKFDLQWEDSGGPVDRLLDGFNLGLGYQF